MIIATIVVIFMWILIVQNAGLSHRMSSIKWSYWHCTGAFMSRWSKENYFAKDVSYFLHSVLSLILHNSYSDWQLKVEQLLTLNLTYWFALTNWTIKRVIRLAFFSFFFRTRHFSRITPSICRNHFWAMDLFQFVGKWHRVYIVLPLLRHFCRIFSRALSLRLSLKWVLLCCNFVSTWTINDDTIIVFISFKFTTCVIMLPCSIDGWSKRTSGENQLLSEFTSQRYSF